MTKPRSRLVRVAKLRKGDEIKLDDGWGLVKEITQPPVGLVTFKVVVQRGSKAFEFPMFGDRAVRIIRR